MNKIIFGSALVCTVFLIVGTYAFPADVIMWFASTSVLFNVFRVIMSVMLLVVLLTTPPRKLWARLAMGGMALSLVLFGIALLFGNTLHILDIIVFMVLGTTFGIEALEFNEDELEGKVASLREQYLKEHSLTPARKFEASSARS